MPELLKKIKRKLASSDNDGSSSSSRDAVVADPQLPKIVDLPNIDPTVKTPGELQCAQCPPHSTSQYARNPGSNVEASVDNDARANVGPHSTVTANRLDPNVGSDIRETVLTAPGSSSTDTSPGLNEPATPDTAVHPPSQFEKLSPVQALGTVQETDRQRRHSSTDTKATFDKYGSGIE